MRLTQVHDGASPLAMKAIDQGTVLRNLFIQRFSVFLAVGLAAAGLAACSSSSSSSGSADAASTAPELSTVTLDARLTPDTGPLWIALKDGLFKQQGLTVNVNYTAGTAAQFSGLAAHTVDFAQQAYVTMFNEEKKNPALAMRVIAEDSLSAPNTNAIMVGPNSKVKTVADLKGKTVAFSSPGFALAELALDEQLKGYGLGPTSYTEDTLAFANMIEPLARGQISAAFSVQPYITQMETQTGAHQLIDVMTGPMLNFPELGWTTTAYFAQRYPRTVAAFQRAIAKAQQLAASNPTLVRQLMPTNIKSITPQIANVIPLPTYVTTLSLTRMQRVATVMEQYGVIPKSFDIQAQIIPLPSGS